MDVSKALNTKIKCGVLGATGSVGQRFILLLIGHPFLTLHALGASSRSEGKPYRDAVSWRQVTPFPADVGHLKIRSCRADAFGDCDLVFSGLGSDIAGEVGKFAYYLSFISDFCPFFSSSNQDG